ncbi:hypothetical protein [Candidatus Neoehrlichia procyonis]|nr:hypothetical protein [Candidatus Neoehrlichia lotoris]
MKLLSKNNIKEAYFLFMSALLIIPFSFFVTARFMRRLHKSKCEIICLEMSFLSQILLNNILFFGLLSYYVFTLYPKLVLFDNKMLSISACALVMSCLLTFSSIIFYNCSAKRRIGECLDNIDDSIFAKLMQRLNFAMPNLILNIVLNIIGKVSFNSSPIMVEKQKVNMLANNTCVDHS